MIVLARATAVVCSVWNRNQSGSRKQDHLWEGLLCNVTCTHCGAWSLFKYTGPGMHVKINYCLHCPATLLIYALSQNDVENTSAFADVTHLTMAEFDKACISLTTKL